MISKIVKSKYFEFPRFLIWVPFAYLPFLWLYSIPLTGDQKVYIATALEMLESGIWRYPILFDEVSFIKPPLQYWATLLSWVLLGFNLFTTLLPSVLCVIGISFLIGKTEGLLGWKEKEAVGPLLFAGSVGALTFGTTAQMEIYLALFYTASWWAFLKFLKQERIGYLYLAFAIAGASGLLKSPLYSCLWVGSALTFLVLKRDWKLFRNPHLYSAWLFGILVGASWYLYVYFTQWERFFHDFLMRETWFKRSGNGLSIGGIWLAFFQFFMPFSVFLLSPIYRLFRYERSSEFFQFVIAWMLIPSFFFSWFPYRVSTYLFFLLPVLCLLIDWARREGAFTDLEKWLGRGVSVIGGVGVAILVFVGVQFGLSIWALVLLVLGGIGASWTFWSASWRVRAVSGLLLVLVIRGIGVDLGEKDLADLRQTVTKRNVGTVAFYSHSNYVWHEFALIGAALGKKARRHTDLPELVKELESGNLLVLTQRELEDFTPYFRSRMGKGFDRIIIEDWNRWPKKSNLDWKSVLRGNPVGVRRYRLLSNYSHLLPR